MRIRQSGWWLAGVMAVAGVCGCAGEEANVQRTSAENTALAHDNARLQRELGDCRRELQQAQKQIADARAAAEGARSAGRADRDTVQEMRQALQQLQSEKEASIKAQDELSRRLLESEKVWAMRAQELARAAKAVRQQEERIAELTQQVESLQRELSAARRSASPPP